MSNQEQGKHLSSISTMWTVLRQAQNSEADEAAAARAQLWERYGGAVRRYLQALLQNAHDAEELTSEFAVALVRGDFRKADPRFGKFRYYVKTVLRHMVQRHRTGKAKLPGALAPDDLALQNLAAPADETDRELDRQWRDELLRRSWKALAQSSAELHTVLQFRADNEKTTSRGMAEQLSGQLGKSLSAEAVRQMLHRARDRFRELLRQEVAQSLDSPTEDQIDEELRDLELLTFF